MHKNMDFSVGSLQQVIKYPVKNIWRWEAIGYVYRFMEMDLHYDGTNTNNILMYRWLKMSLIFHYGYR